MSAKKLLLGTIGIYIAYLSLSLINERLFTHNYISNRSKSGTRTHKFNYPDLVICFGAIFCAIYSKAMSIICKQSRNPVPFIEEIRMSGLFTINILSASYSLLYISYPIRVVGDKLGYLSAVIVGVYFTRMTKGSGLKLPPKKMLIALLITAGALMFALLKNKESGQASMLYDPSKQWLGYVLLLISISAEALFSDNQAYVKVTYRPTLNQLMYSVNAYTFLICLLHACLTRTFVPSLRFVHEHPLIMRDILMVALLQLLGQISIYFVILNFKQHMFPLVATTRKVFTVLLSIFVFNHSINGYQWVALVLVFGGMGYELLDELYLDIQNSPNHSISEAPKLVSSLKSPKNLKKLTSPKRLKSNFFKRMKSE